jgi:hypothetical protein
MAALAPPTAEAHWSMVGLSMNWARDPDDPDNPDDVIWVDMTEQGLVNCDQNCDALLEPITLEETRKALEHWRKHSLLHGCSHAAV